ncbi:MAG TPA: hypothetical protein VJI67_00975 [archaeon]|nr:hypothetical protein [archaeon]HLD80866.1 hypothetical protein [archaeon]
MAGSVPREEIAFKLVELYLEEAARTGFKRNLEFDDVINAYFYALGRLNRQSQELAEIAEVIRDEEAKLVHETKEELFPSVARKSDQEKKR